MSSSARLLERLMGTGHVPLICCATYTEAEKQAPLYNVPLVKGCCTPQERCSKPQMRPTRWMDEKELDRWEPSQLSNSADSDFKSHEISPFTHPTPRYATWPPCASRQAGPRSFQRRAP